MTKIIVLIILMALAPKAFAMDRIQAHREASALSKMGGELFADRGLSASGAMSCATCHRPDMAFASSQVFGFRAVPSLRYLQSVPQFTLHYFSEDFDGSLDNGPTGGLTWDGRVDRKRDQAVLPLLSPIEMANGPKRFEKGYRGIPLKRVLIALEAYQERADLFYPYSSRYDDYLKGKGRLSAAEERGLALFEDPEKGNCARCHISRIGRDGAPPQFTDYGLIALGVPRNRKLAANQDPHFFDLGVCGPLRKGLADQSDLCGRFKTPSLRNVATRGLFFHNGVYSDLRDAVRFYFERDMRPIDDLPEKYRANLDREPPFGGKVQLTPTEVDDIIAFLGTLTDR